MEMQGLQEGRLLLIPMVERAPMVEEHFPVKILPKLTEVQLMQPDILLKIWLRLEFRTKY